MHNHASAHTASFGYRFSYTANAVRFNLGQAGARAVEQAASALPFLPLFFSAGHIQHEMRIMCRALRSALPSFISACARCRYHAHSTIAILLVQVAIPAQLHLFRSSLPPHTKVACLVKIAGLLGTLALILLAELPVLANPPTGSYQYLGGWVVPPRHTSRPKTAAPRQAISIAQTAMALRQYPFMPQWPSSLFSSAPWSLAHTFTPQCSLLLIAAIGTSFPPPGSTTSACFQLMRPPPLKPR